MPYPVRIARVDRIHILPHGLPVLVDPKGLDYSRYNGASLLTPNRTEAFFAAGFQQDAGTSVEVVASRLMNSLDMDALLITEGEFGMTLFERRDSAIHIPASARAVYDVTGAGDTVVATMGLALAAGGSLRMAAYLANLAAGLAVEQVGTATVTAAKLESVLEDQGYVLPSFSEIPATRSVQ
jgi:D-beta-D-heptose 7-phosphate kinase/D-beta-D-heptose 1-phosphate adenosyltransferase